MNKHGQQQDRNYFLNSLNFDEIQRNFEILFLRKNNFLKNNDKIIRCNKIINDGKRL